jgi:hypothetical protein
MGANVKTGTPKTMRSTLIQPSSQLAPYVRPFAQLLGEVSINRGRVSEPDAISILTSKRSSRRGRGSFYSRETAYWWPGSAITVGAPEDPIRLRGLHAGLQYMPFKLVWASPNTSESLRGTAVDTPEITQSRTCNEQTIDRPVSRRA